jgi:hypothetical protein
MAAAKRVFDKSNAVTGFLMPETASGDTQKDAVQ